METDGAGKGGAGLSIRPVERKILYCAAAVLAGIAAARRFGMLPGAAVGGAVAGAAIQALTRAARNVEFYRGSFEKAEVRIEEGLRRTLEWFRGRRQAAP